MLLQQVGVVAEVSQVGMGELMKVAAAIQKQASRDFAPIWGVKATVNAFRSSTTCRSVTGRSS
jgi:hypothetical protein